MIARYIAESTDPRRWEHKVYVGRSTMGGVRFGVERRAQNHMSLFRGSGQETDFNNAIRAAPRRCLQAGGARCPVERPRNARHLGISVQGPPRHEGQPHGVLLVRQPRHHHDLPDGQPLPRPPPPTKERTPPTPSASPPSSFTNLRKQTSWGGGQVGEVSFGSGSGSCQQKVLGGGQRLQTQAILIWPLLLQAQAPRPVYKDGEITSFLKRTLSLNPHPSFKPHPSESTLPIHTLETPPLHTPLLESHLLETSLLHQHPSSDCFLRDAPRGFSWSAGSR
ncbi:hypothetical protein B9479_002777 [Cryptococcus floricola]|uniref:Uncharacterized protein n=1 Tax=Cryptococcus floricola TaxID=2591691 RepID=A0A5D3B2N7_9TREE|nr:hypothetical protein B9479_002777 [Cryptococcus floricola]